jgi:sensor histidine kinase regulating citrate/malate metabolism
MSNKIEKIINNIESNNQKLEKILQFQDKQIIQLQQENQKLKEYVDKLKLVLIENHIPFPSFFLY